MKRIISLALCFLLVFTLSQPAFAAENVCEIEGGTSYPTLDGALAAVKNGETIRLLGNIDYDGGLVIDGADITFDLNGYTLNVNNSTGTGIKVRNGGKVECINWGTKGSFNVTGYEYGVWADASTVVRVNNITSKGSTAYNFGVFAKDSAEVIVENDIVVSGYSSRGVAANGGVVTVKGDVSLTEGSGESVGLDVFNEGSVVVEGSVNVCGNGVKGIIAESEASVNIRGDVTATGFGSIGISAKEADVSVGRDVVGKRMGISARKASVIHVAGNVTSTAGNPLTDESGRGIEINDECQITVGGNVQSNDIGVNIIVNDPAQHTPSKINIAGEITAPEYISIWDTSLGYEDYNGITPSGYRIYEVITDGSSGSYTLGTVYVKVEGEIPVVPTAPQDLTATPGDGQVALSWTAPSSDGGSAITKYQVSKDNGANWTDVGLNTTYTFTGLTNGMAYTFKVRAVNSAGNGAEASTSATPEAVHVSTHTINFYSSGSLYASKTVTGGSALGTNWPDDPTRSGYSFGGWFTGQNGMGTQYMSDTIITSDVDLYAKWTYSDSGRQTVQTPVYQANVRAEDGMEKVLPVTVGGDTGSVFTEEDPWNTRPKGRIVITMPSIPGVGTYSVGIPVPNLSTSDVMGWLTVDTKAGSITVPSNMLTGVSGISGSKAVIAIGQGDKDNLPDTVKAAIGDRPMVQLALSIDGKQTDWSNSNAPVTVSIPYTPTAKELANPENIVVWYIDSSGKVVPVPNGRYDPATRTVTFTTTLFSNYAVAYNPVAFNDVAADAWYHKAVSFVAAREISNGTGNGNYSPELKLTRGEFIVLMLRAYGIVPDTSPADNFSDAGNTYYTGYLAAAKRLGIAAGVGNNMYALGKEITRQEMFTLLYNALSVIGQLPQGSSGKTLQDFSDAAEVASWAEEAMSNFVETGTVFGSGGKLIPTGTATRAEIAQVLYNLLSK